jgi:hypothetical protein
MYVTTAFVTKTSVTAILTGGRQDSLLAILRLPLQHLLWQTERNYKYSQLLPLKTYIDLQHILEYMSRYILSREYSGSITQHRNL